MITLLWEANASVRDGRLGQRHAHKLAWCASWLLRGNTQLLVTNSLCTKHVASIQLSDWCDTWTAITIVRWRCWGKHVAHSSAAGVACCSVCVLA